MTDAAAENSYPGERLGLPSAGSGSIARPGRRIAALAIDWACAVIVSIAFFAFTALIAVDTFVLLFTLNRRAKERFPDKADRKGITLYAVLRTLQLRRLRLPPPRVKRGGAPIAS